MRILTSLLIACAGLFSVASAQFDGFGFGMPGQEQQQQLVATSATASVDSYKEGSPFFIAFKGDITAPWHAYYRNPATVGMPLEATLAAPAGFKVEGPFWKLPKREEGMAGISYSYSAPALVWRVTPEAGAPAEASFTLSSSAQVCSDSGCMPPEAHEDTLALKKGEAAPAADWDAALLSDIEVLGDTPMELVASQQENAIELAIVTDGPIESAYFFSDDNSINPAVEQKLEAGPGGSVYKLTLPRNDGSDVMYPVADAESAGKPLPALKGVLRVDGKHCRVDLTLSGPDDKGKAGETTPAEATPAPEGDGADTASEGMGLWALFGSLFLGGLILNLMPCVFPVIGLKVMSFVELGGGSRRKVFMHSLTFVLGVLVSFWVLSILLIIFSNLEALAQAPWQQWGSVLLDDAGAGMRSWASWMQNEWVVYAILLLLLIMGLAMYGVFEIGVGATGMGQNLQSKEGYWGSFFSGLFVTVVATPCSGPFIGTTMPVAMALQGPMMVAALTFMALGLASPYMVLGAFPGLVNKLPRPGAWMESLKQGLSFLLFAAAGWALFIYIAFIPQSRLMWTLIALVGICCACWVYGRWCPLYRSKGARITGFICALAILGVSVYYSMPWSSDAAEPAPKAEETASAEGYTVMNGSSPVWNHWTPELMAKALADGHPVYVDFTANWCVTCQANKGVAYSKEVCELLTEEGVVMMKADKTRPNADIDAEMRRLKRSSVPVNALYQPDEEPAVTRELLTAAYLLEWLYGQLGYEDDTEGEATEATPEAPAAEETPAAE